MGWWTDLVQHAQDVLLALGSHHVLGLTEGVDVEPRLEATQQTRLERLNLSCEFKLCNRQRKTLDNVRLCHERGLSERTDLLRSSKTSGRRKLRRDQSSAKLFCSGVPVSSSLLSVGSTFSSRTSRQLRFLILWPSSTIRYFHW